MDRPAIWWHRNSHTLRLRSLKNTDTGAYVNSGTVQVTKVVDERGATLAGATFPVALAYVGGSNGEWKATVPGDLATAVGRRCFAIVEINPSGEPRGYLRLELVVRERTE